MIDLNNLIDYLPYYFKDSDTYKDKYGKGLLERFLDICGSYLSDYPLKDLEEYLSNMDNLDKIPELYLTYYWEFLGSFPFINNPVFNDSAASLSLKSFKNINKEDILVQYGDNPFSSLKVNVREFLKYTIALYRIRGTKTFYDVIISLFYIPSTKITVDDKQVFTLKDPVYDLDKTNIFNDYDGEYKYDEIIDHPDTPVIKFEIVTPNYVGDELLRWRESVVKLFKYFAPYNSKQEFEFYQNGELLTEERTISLSIPLSSIISIDNPVGISVDITGDLKEYQVAVTLDENEPDEGSWSNPLTASKVYANYRGCELTPLYYWARLYEDHSIKSKPLLIHQRLISYNYDFKVEKVTTLDGKEIGGNLELNRDNPEYYLFLSLVKQRVILNSYDKPGDKPNTELVDPGYIYDEYNGVSIKPKIEGNNYVFDPIKISNEGTYRFYALENPYQVITVNVTKANISYNIDFNPNVIYFNIQDSITYYEGKSLSDKKVNTFEIIVEDDKDGKVINGIKLEINDVKVTTDSSSNSVNNKNIANRILSILRGNLTDIKSGDSIDLSTLFKGMSDKGLSLDELNQSSKVLIQFNINGSTGIGILTLNNMNLYTYELGIIRNGEFIIPTTPYPMGTRLTFAVRFSGKNIDTVIRSIEELKSDSKLRLRVGPNNPLLGKVSDTLYTYGYTLPYRDEAYKQKVSLYWDDNISMEIDVSYVDSTTSTSLKWNGKQYPFTPDESADQIELLVEDGNKAYLQFIFKNGGIEYPSGSIVSAKIKNENGEEELMEYQLGTTYSFGEGIYKFIAQNMATQEYSYLNVNVKIKQPDPVIPPSNPLVITSISCSPTQAILYGTNGASTNISMTYTGDLVQIGELDYMLKSVTDVDDPGSFKIGERIPYNNAFTTHRAGKYTFCPSHEDFRDLECTFEVTY